MKVVAPTIITLAALVLVATAPSATTARTTRVSVSTSQQQGDRPSWTAGVSASGRFVAFTSQATDLVPGDTNDRQDAFVIDRKNGRTQRVSVSSSGAQAKAGPNPDGGSAALGISANGRYVLFRSDASNLVPGDTNGKMDAFVRDRATGKTRRIPPAGLGVYAGALSANGRYAVLEADENVYGYDLRRRHLLPLTAGANGWSEEPSISARGRYVAFTSIASNLVRGDTNKLPDVFVRDVHKGKTTRVSVTSSGRQGVGKKYSNGSNAADDLERRSLHRLPLRHDQSGPARHERRLRHLRARPAEREDAAGERQQRRRQSNAESGSRRKLQRRTIATSLSAHSRRTWSRTTATASPTCSSATCASTGRS